VQSKVVDPEVVLWVFFYVLIVELKDIYRVKSNGTWTNAK